MDLVERDPTFREQLIEVFDDWQSALAWLLQAGQSQLQPYINLDILAEELLTLIEGRIVNGTTVALTRAFEAWLWYCPTLVEGGIGLKICTIKSTYTRYKVHWECKAFALLN